MRCVSDLTPDSQALLVLRQDIEHGDTRDERGGAQWNLEFMRRTIVVSDGLVLAFRYLHRVKGGYLGRREVVQGSVDVPSIEASVAFRRVLWGNLGLMETRVLGVLQLGFGETLVVVNSTVSDELNLRNPGDRLKVRVKDRLGVLLGFVIAMAIDIALRVKSLDGEGIITAMRPGIRHSHPTYLREAVLLLRREINVPEQ